MQGRRSLSGGRSYAAPLPQPGETLNQYSLQCTCVASDGSKLDAGTWQVPQCSSDLSSQCSTVGGGAAKCPQGYVETGKCAKTRSSWPDRLYDTNIPHHPSFYTFNHYLGPVGTPARTQRDVYGDRPPFPGYQ